jgi:hypothetical protein
MKIMLSVMLVAGLGTSALAQDGTGAAPATESTGTAGSAGSIGVGAERGLRAGISSDVAGLSGNYDAGPFHVGAFLGFLDGDGDDDTSVLIGGRFYYHLHQTAISDFSVGGSVSVSSLENTAGDRDTQLFIEPGFQMRAFVAANVALSFTGGLSIGVVDASGVELTAQPTGSAGVHYYFF